MPRPSTSRPAARVRHGIAKTSPARVVGGQLVPRHRAGEDDVPGDAGRPAPAARSVGSVRSAADDQQRGVRHPRAGSPAAPGSACPAPCAAPAGTRRRRPAGPRARSRARTGVAVRRRGGTSSSSTPGGSRTIQRGRAGRAPRRSGRGCTRRGR